ncbi:Fic family protein [Flavobacterium sp.]|uniref:Fic family protein n=1 Tax=Flavobacterium sp. TaxID=239 RepID=UPI00286D94C4|nr:Fic family protein [Flavobacterium sp.]
MENSTKALELKSILDKLRPINKEQEDRIMQKFRLDWNYHSNHLEGNTLTYGETKALLLFGITAQGKPLKDHFEITGHNEAINWVIDVVKGDYPLTENFIRELHSLLLKEPYEVDAITPDGKPTKKRINIGSYKTSANHVKTKTGEIFYFATPEETPAKMYDLLVWYNEKILEKLNPILLAAEFHYKFIRIHPFDDGNGRTARIIMNFILMKFGYPPVIIKTQDKDNYFAVLQLADAGNLESFLEYIAQNLIRSLDIMIAGANGENIEEEDDLDKEIALLEQRLNFIGEKSEKVKSLLVIKEIFDLTIVHLHLRLFSKLSKFDVFYLNKEITVEIENKILGTKYYYEGIKKLITENTNFINFKTNFKNFKNIGFDNFDYESFVSFNFNILSYTVIFNKDDIIEKPYGTQLTDSEIDKILKSEVKRHKEFIEQKIAEKESNL